MSARTPVDYRLLEAMERFRLLTIEQGTRLGIANYKHVAERLRSLDTAKLVHVTKRGKLAGPHVFCLSPKGAVALAEWREDTTAPAARKMPFGDTEHLNQRVAIADVHMALRGWAERIGAVVDWVRVEFDPNPKGLEPVTTVTHNGVRYDPDAVAAVTTPDGESWLLALEVETGGRAGRLSNFAARLESRLHALRNAVPEKGFDWPTDGKHRAARMLFVFKSPAMLAEAKRMVAGMTGPEWRRVFFHALPLDGEAFASGWWNLDASTGGPLRAIGRP